MLVRLSTTRSKGRVHDIVAQEVTPRAFSMSLSMKAVERVVYHAAGGIGHQAEIRHRVDLLGAQHGLLISAISAHWSPMRSDRR